MLAALQRVSVFEADLQPVYLRSPAFSANLHTYQTVIGEDIDFSLPN